MDGIQVNTSALIIVVVYLVAMLVVGYFVGKLKIKNSKDYMVAGRRMGLFMVAFSLSANNIGGGSTTGLAQKAFGSWGLSAIWYVLAASIAMIPLAFLAPKIRKTMALTIPEVVGRRFGKVSAGFTVVLNILALFCLTASQIGAAGIVVNSLTGIPQNVCLLIAGIVVIAYTTLGGMIADQITDLVQFVIILIGLFITFLSVMKGVGGWQAMANKLPPVQMSFTKIGWVSIIGYIFNYFCTFLSGPEMVSRFESAKDEKTAKYASLLSGVLMAAMAFFPTALGLAALAFKDSIPNIAANGSNSLMAVTGAYAPTFITGLVSAAIISATMSSADSNLLCMSTMIMNDLFIPYSGKQFTEKQMVLATRLCNVICCCVAMLVSFLKISLVTMNTFAFAIRCAGPFAAYGLGLIIKNCSKNSGIISIITGTIGVIIWQILSKGNFYFGILPVVFGCAISVITFFIVNLIEINVMHKPSAPSPYLSDDEVAALIKHEEETHNV